MTTHYLKSEARGNAETYDLPLLYITMNEYEDLPRQLLFVLGCYCLTHAMTWFSFALVVSTY